MTCPKMRLCDPMQAGLTPRMWTTVLADCLTYERRLHWDNLAGFEDELALCVWWETLVQQQHPWTVCGSGWIPPCSSTTASTIPNVAHLNAEGKLVAWMRGRGPEVRGHLYVQSVHVPWQQSQNMIQIRAYHVQESAVSSWDVRNSVWTTEKRS